MFKYPKISTYPFAQKFVSLNCSMVVHEVSVDNYLWFNVISVLFNVTTFQAIIRIVLYSIVETTSIIIHSN